MDSQYVQSVSYSSQGDIWVGATSAGEVKLWKNSEKMQFLGTINSKTWQNDSVMNHLEANLASRAQRSSIFSSIDSNQESKPGSQLDVSSS